MALWLGASEVLAYIYNLSGFGTHMTNSKMVILWQNSDGSVTISQRFATAQVEPVTDPNPPRIATLDQPSTIVSNIISPPCVISN